jgi:DNA-dependent RNA polymerase auxiliary subunit epsilon
MGNPPQPPLDPSTKVSTDPVFVRIIGELNVNQDQLQKRQKLLREIEAQLSDRYGAQNRVLSYMFRFDHSQAIMHSSDIPSLEAILNSTSGTEQLALILHSPGGDPTIVEKMVDMCRSHLSGNHKKFRIIVPNVAKSAATVMALGSDEIVMGYCSELGPIDPQVQTVESGQRRWVSAFAFVDARDDLVKKIRTAVKKKEPTLAFVTQLAGLNIPYTQEMENWIEFAKKTAATLLDKYMLQAKFPQAERRKKKADEIVRKLLSKQLFPVHGQFIDAATAQKLDLEIELIDRGEKLWELIWEYYIRSEVQMNVPLQPPLTKTKLFESSSASLVVQGTAT